MAKKRTVKYNIFKKLVYHTLFSLLFGLVFILPDLVYSLINESYKPILNVQEFAAFVFLSFLLLMIRSVWIRAFYFTILLIFPLAELSHYAYFGTLISPYAIPLIVSQAYDIGESFFAMISYIYAPIALTLMVMVPVIFALLRYDEKLEKNSFRVRYMGWVVFTLLVFGPIKAFISESAYLFMPNMNSYSVKNLYMAMSWLSASEIQSLVDPKPKPSFKPYQVRQTEHALPANNVVVIMGESLGYEHMALFGADLETSPQLNKLAKNGELIARRAFSCGVSTDVAVPTFFLLKREPENTDMMASGETNLFRMAKERGYTVHYISTQSAAIMKGFIGRYVDHSMTREDFEKNAKGVVFDQVLLDYLKGIDLSKPNFIVLHQRNSHSPYEKYTPQKFRHYSYDEANFNDFTRKTYANSLRYTDALLAEMIAHLRQTSPLPFIFFATSDHGELLGENGKYGHGQLDQEIAKVPFLCAFNMKKSLLTDEILKSKDGLSHYDMGKFIAASLGYAVNNPNDDGTRYINGVELSGRGDFISYDPAKQKMVRE